jgi:hypothetical protein
MELEFIRLSTPDSRMWGDIVWIKRRDAPIKRFAFWNVESAVHSIDRALTAFLRARKACGTKEKLGSKSEKCPSKIL